MKKYAFLAPTPEIAKRATAIALEEGRLDVAVRHVSTAECVDAARDMVEQGAEIIIARGTQAEAIMRNLDTPVVEVVLTAQEMGLVIQQARQELGISRPKLAVVGYRNMFCDMKHFNQLFDIDLREYYVRGTESLPDGVLRAEKDQADMVIGGEIVCTTARELGLRCIMQPHGDDSIRTAFRVASNVAYAAEQKKKTVSELNTLLDFSFSGLIKLDRDGGITALNHKISDLFGVATTELVGRHIDRIIPGLYNDFLRLEVLGNGQDIFTVVRASRLVLAVSASPIKVSERIEGAIVSCHEVDSLTEMEAEVRKELQGEENRAGKYQQYFEGDNVFMRAARHYAKFDTHLLIASEPGMPRYIPAKLIHRESLRSDRPFLSFSCASAPREQHAELLFGKGGEREGLLPLSSGGTLFLDNVEQLDEQVQYRLYNVLVTEQLWPNQEEEEPLDLRILAGSDKNLWKLVSEGRFSHELFFLITTLVLSLPPLDAERWAPIFIQQYCNRHFRYLHLTRSARAAIAEHSWNGLVELDSFCERLVVTAPQRTVDAAMIGRMLSQDMLMREYPERFSRDPEAARLASLLERFDGNRGQVAEALGISKTTLWRRMKKLGLYDGAVAELDEHPAPEREEL